MNEWSLLIFTYMMNAAAGLCVVSGGFAVHLSRCLPADSFKRFMMLTIFIICTIAGAGSVASITHLGVPLNAPNAVNNVFSAWLSREVVVTAAFVGALGVSFLWLWKTGKFSFLLYGGAMAVGLADIFCMASIYRYTSILTWNDINTYLMFYGTTLTLGAVLFVLVVMVMVIRKAGRRAGITLPADALSLSQLWQLWGVMAVSLIGRLLYQPFYAHYLTRTQLTHKSVTFPLSPIEAYDSIAGLRIGVRVAAVIGVALCGISLVRAQKKAHSGLPVCAGFISGCLLTIAAEFMLRYVFYYIHI
ncbi:dimethyl sulfoxide reductase anchor subunit family protein [Morganella morganii]|uniref:dimethyl sulfoxide reductase anchor subunit family protein n=1 Tax=Morganella morganii TaxID=582 RepID=UPI0034E574DD